MENMGHAGSSYIASLLNSSPRLDFGVLGGLPALDGTVAASGCLEKLCGDPGFAERAARLSSFGGQRYPGAGGLFGLPAPAPAASNGEFGGSRAESSVSDPASAVKDATANGNCKKRKAAGGKGKGKEPSLSSSSCKGAEAKESDAKRCKLEENTVQPKVEQTGSDSSTEDRGRKPGKEKNSKPVEPPKDYVHVRARRGQATDSHSLAERVRREKISQRMKVLQDLVPGCNKVTGKALMLDEIINYVQSLQQQVEFLSMKLTTVNPQLNFGNLPALLQKDVYQACGPSASSVFPLEGAGEGFPYGDQVDLFQSFALNGMESQCSLSPLDSALSHATNTQYAFQNETTNATLQQTNFWEDSLQTVPHVDNGQTQENGALAQSFHGW